MLSRFSVRVFVTLWTVAHQAPLSIGFSSQEYWSELLYPFPADLPYPGIEPASLMSLALAGGFFTTSITWEDWNPRLIKWSLGETFASVILWNFSSGSKYPARAKTHCCSRDHAQARPLSESKPPCWYDGLLLFSVLSVTRAPGQGRPPLALNLPQLGCWEIESFSVWNRLRAPGGL